MLTIENLKELGADTVNGLARCIGDENFYFKMVSMSLQDAHFKKLNEAVEKGDLDTAFECAHALKGVLGNVGLTSLYDPIADMTEDLRARKEIDYSGYMETIIEELAKLRNLL